MWKNRNRVVSCALAFALMFGICGFVRKSQKRAVKTFAKNPETCFTDLRETKDERWKAFVNGKGE